MYPGSKVGICLHFFLRSLEIFNPRDYRDVRISDVSTACRPQILVHLSSQLVFPALSVRCNFPKHSGIISKYRMMHKDTNSGSGDTKI